MAASNTYTGPTTISAGTLQIGNGGAAGSLSSGTASAITDNGTLVFNCSGTVTQGTNFSSAAIKGNGSLVQAGPGTLVLTDTNSFTGGTTVDGGTLQLNVGGENGTLAGSLIAVKPGATLVGNATDPLGYFAGAAILTINDGRMYENTGYLATITSLNMTGGTLMPAAESVTATATISSVEH